MFKVRVSATSANIGAGFDTMGLSLNIYNEVEFSHCDEPFRIETDNGLPKDETNLVYWSMCKVFDIFKKTQNVCIRQTNRIPIAAGLGSSAACIVAGVIGANKMLGNPLNESEVVNLCVKLDGHPDNVVPAIMGGIATGVVMDNGHVEYIKCNAPIDLFLYAATPSFPLLTKIARSVLPSEYSKEDVIFSLSRAVLTFASLVSGDIDKLKVVGDKIHEPYRKPLIEGYDEVCKALKNAGAISTYLSGAGPTIIGFFKSKAEVLLPQGWGLKELKIDNSGVQIIEV